MCALAQSPKILQQGCFRGIGNNVRVGLLHISRSRSVCSPLMRTMNGATAADYELLGITPEASTSEVKAAYRRLSTKCHPDAGGTDSLFRQITEAYDRILATGPSTSTTDEPWDPFKNVRDSWESQQAPWEETEEEAANYASTSGGAKRDDKRSDPVAETPAKRSSVRLWAAPFLLGRGPSTSFGAFLLFALSVLVFFQVATSTMPDPFRGIVAVLPVVLAVGRIAAMPTRLKR